MPEGVGFSHSGYLSIVRAYSTAISFSAIDAHPIQYQLSGGSSSNEMGWINILNCMAALASSLLALDIYSSWSESSIFVIIVLVRETKDRSLVF